MCILFYLAIYLPFIAGIEEDWETYCPSIIPVMSVSGLATAVLTLVALWPVWGWLTPLILIVLFMGYTMVLTLMPSGFIGTLLSWLLIFAASATSHYIPHEG